MKNFIKIASGVDVTNLKIALHHNPQLWDACTIRKDNPASPHKEMQDIWVRYRDPKELNEQNVGDIHFPVWLDAYYKLPQLRSIIFALMAKLEAEHLGAVLITKIQPGGKIYPHVDGGWHADFYNTKVYIPIQTNDGVVNRVEDEYVVMKEGEVWYWDNSKEHDVVNNGKEDRITLIVCLRTGG
jgi:hypothetical protein